MSKKNKRKSHLYSSQPLKENVKRIILKRCFKFIEEEGKYKCTCCPDNSSCNCFDSASKAYNHTFTLLFEALDENEEAQQYIEQLIVKEIERRKQWYEANNKTIVNESFDDSFLSKRFDESDIDINKTSTENTDINILNDINMNKNPSSNDLTVIEKETHSTLMSESIIHSVSKYNKNKIKSQQKSNQMKQKFQITFVIHFQKYL